MLKHTLLIALRTLRRQPGYTTVNVVGFGIGVACCLMILLYVQAERSYDRFFAEAEQIYRVVVDRTAPNGTVRTAMSPRPLAAALASEYPEVAAATRLSRERAGQVLVRHADRRFFEERFFFADSNFFDVFSVPLQQGDASTALREPFSIILTKETARRYFGDEDPIGQTLDIRLQGDGDVFAYQVTGVAASLPGNTHFHFDFLASYQQHPLVGDQGDQDNWAALTLYTYLHLREESDPQALAAKLPETTSARLASQIEENLDITFEEFLAAGNAFHYTLQPLTAIHLHSQRQDEIEANGNIVYVYLLSAIALFILLIACINFINLATARSASRAREVGVRKVVGAERPHLIRRFLLESVLLSIMGLGIALVLIEVFLPVFNALAGVELKTAYAENGGFLVGLGGLVVLVGMLAGFYPAVYLSRFRPADVLKGAHGSPRRQSTLRNHLIVFQFAVTVVLIAGTAVMYRQVDYMLGKSLGFGQEQVIVIEGTEAVRTRMEAFKHVLAEEPGVVQVTNAQTVPGRDFGRTQVRAAEAPNAEQVSVAWMSASYGYVETLGMELAAGRSFDRAVASDSMAVLLNETAARELGLADPIGQQLIWRGRTYAVVGIVKDFHFASMHEAIGPLVIFGPDPFNQNRPNLLVAARIRGEDVPGMLAALEHAWAAFLPEQPFAYSFLDRDIDRLYRQDRRTGQIVGGFAALAILVACLGLFGLAAFTAEQRTKEIGIRKVVGATVFQVVLLLSRDFLKLVLIAIACALPVVYFIMGLWLQGFAYRIEIRGGEFLMAGLAALGIAWVTVSYHALRAALTDPVKALRYE